MRGQFFSSARLEKLAAELLAEYQRDQGSPLMPPIQADLVAESEGLDILWQEIPEEPYQTVLGGLAPESRLIVLNEHRKALFDDDPGLYNTIVGHEVAHWRLHVDHDALSHSALPSLRTDLAFVCKRGAQNDWDERNAHRFMSYLLLPYQLLRPKLAGLNLQNWRSLYRLREHFDVTITGLRIRLEQMNLTYVDNSGLFHKSKQEAGGQDSLF